MITLDHDKHEIVKLQLQRLEWAGTEGRFCPECGGARPKDGARTVLQKSSTGQEIEAVVDAAITVSKPNPHEGHGVNCKLAASIAITSGPKRIVVYVTESRTDDMGNTIEGTPRGYEEGK